MLLEENDDVRLKKLGPLSISTINNINGNKHNYGEEDNYLLSDSCKSISVNNNKEKDDNKNVDNINETILSNQNLKRKNDNSFCQQNNKKIDISTKGKPIKLNNYYKISI